MLLIAVSHGAYGDPFTCSTTAGIGEVDPNDADACRAYICTDKGIPLISVDEVLVVELTSPNEPEVTHHHGDKLSMVVDSEFGCDDVNGHIEDCISDGYHLKDVDSEGYCTHCGHK